LISEFGDADTAALRDLATFRLVLEDVQAAVIAGDAAAREDMVRIRNVVGRMEASLREAAVASQSQPPNALVAYLATKQAAEASADE
jgi:hypothetical protein